MINNLLCNLFNVFTGPNPKSEAKVEAIVPEPCKLDGEVKKLEEHFGPLQDRTLEVTLKELNAIIPRNRVRIDSYSKLVRHLLATRNLVLKIYSNKTRSI